MGINAPKYSEPSRTAAISIMHNIRERLFLPDEAERGTRFNNDNHTMWVLESQTKEPEFTSDPVHAVANALIESAKSDWWYNSRECDYKWRDDPEYDDDADYEVEE
jgi:hypothetical protein